MPTSRDGTEESGQPEGAVVVDLVERRQEHIREAVTAVPPSVPRTDKDIFVAEVYLEVLESEKVQPSDEPLAPEDEE